MSGLMVFMVRVVGSALAILIGCLGMAILEDDALGWPLLGFGVTYPPTAILYYHRRGATRRAD